MKKEETASLILLNGSVSAIFKVIAWNVPKTAEKTNAAIQWCLSCSFLQAFCAGAGEGLPFAWGGN